MMIQRASSSLCILILAAVAFLPASALGASTLLAPHVEVKIVSDSSVVAPGRPFRVGVRFAPEQGWHLYWKNPGDSGLAPRISWSVPGNASAGGLEWPFPERIPFGPLVNFGYKKSVILFSRFQLSSNAEDRVTISAHAEWVVCREECIASEGDLQTGLQVSPKGEWAPSEWKAEFDQAEKDVPEPLDWVTAKASADQQDLILDLESKGPPFPAGTLTFFPANRRLIDLSSEQRIEKSDAHLRFVMKRASAAKRTPSQFAGVLIGDHEWVSNSGRRAITIDTPLQTADKDAAPFGTNVATAVATESFDIALLLGAFLGGFLLNLMPCVLPVLSLKFIGMIQHPRVDAKWRRLQGAAYGLGVLVGFWSLASVLFMLKSAGSEVGWGFQLQHSAFVVCLCFLVLVIALNLFGVFEVGDSIQRWAGRFGGGATLAGSLLNGLLVTALATPCTAPFMGTAIAVALVVPVPQAFLIFTALGLGMASPYVVLSFVPQAVRLLPRPGPWMITLRRLLAFPLLATLVWLLSVFHEQVGGRSLITLLLALLLVSFGMFLYGESQKREGRLVRRSGLVAALASIVLAAITISPSSPLPGSVALVWEPYSDSLLESYMKQGRPVFVDFTAAWCITCQFNKRMVFGTESFARSIKNLNVVLLRADWTSKDPGIERAIRRYGRRGVPVDVLYSGNPDKDPLILPPLLTPGIVMDAFETELPGAGGSQDGQQAHKPENK